MSPFAKELQARIMASSLETFRIRSADILTKDPLDYGGFGEVFLCRHKTLGPVVLKAVFTGLLRNEDSKRSLQEEGALMTKLCHERVVKLLGVIMEDGDYSLVMELIPMGNLKSMLQQVTVPISIRGRIVLEILEGMVYLTENNVIHKDLKPENILVDQDFHIKIADLGLATCESWSKLTREESRRKSRSVATAGTQGAGTLSYMAPEHLEDINIRSTEKSDVYSFAIVLWVILTGRDPYENARNENQVCMCVRNGNRPAEDLIAEDIPREMVDLMKSCWHKDPKLRPTFQEGYKMFLPFYTENLEDLIEKDSHHLREMYDGPEGLVEKLKTLTIPSESASADGPASLLSSDRSGPSLGPSLGPVEASVEDLHYEVPADPIQTDAQGVGAEGPHATSLEQKLDRELQYHKNGSYTFVGQPHSADPSQPDHSRLRRAVSELPQHPGMSSVRPATAEPSEDGCYRPDMGIYESMVSAASSAKSHHKSTVSSNPSLAEHRLVPPEQASAYERQKSWPTYPVPDTAAADYPAGLRFTPNTIGPLQDTGYQGWCIQNASAIQIGNNNSLSIRGSDSSLGGPSNSMLQLKQALLKYDDQAVTEEHLNLLRDNIGSNWKRCARRLGLTNVEVEAVDHDYCRDGLHEMVHQMLERWRMKEGSLGCTVGKLCQALGSHIPVDVIQKLLSACQKSSST
uniref:Receptor-interacting serine/threonine-protein kinase 1 n=2 Tax=Gadus morhua TaxID=8049 RepID=A0A8C5F9P1_GADMO